MEASDELLTIAELAIGLAGFSGVVVAFTRQGALKPTDRFRFLGLFTQALTVVLLSFVPFGFHHAGQDGATLWRASSGIATLSWLFNSWLIGVRLRPRFSPEEALPRYTEGTLWTIALVQLSLHLANLTGWPMGSGALFYLIPLVLLLALSAFFFASLVLWRSQE